MDNKSKLPAKLDQPGLLESKHEMVESRIIGNQEVEYTSKAIEGLQELDDLVLDIINETGKAFEIFGWGVTQETDDGKVRVIDFVVPNKDKIFIIDELFLSRKQAEFAELIAQDSSFKIEIRDGVVTLSSRDISIEIAIQKNSLEWSDIKKHLEAVIGLELPDNIADFQTLLVENYREEQNGGVYTIESDYDLVLSGSSVWITQGFNKRAEAKAKESQGDLGYAAHHHPVLGLAGLALEDKSRPEKEQYYQKLLQFSPPDITYMKQVGVDLFEIRAFGDGEDFHSEEAKTVRYYSVEQIESETAPLAEALKVFEAEELDLDLVDQVVEAIQRQIIWADEQNQSFDVLLKYYLGDDKFRAFKDMIRPGNNPSEFILYQLINTKDRKGFEVTRELLETRQEVDIAGKVASLGELYQSNVGRKKVEDFMKSHGLQDAFEVTSSIDAERVRYIADHIQTFLDLQSD